MVLDTSNSPILQSTPLIYYWVISYFSATAKLSEHHINMTSVMNWTARWQVLHQEDDSDQSRYLEYLCGGAGGPVMRPDCHLSDVTVTWASSEATIIPSVSINHSGSISRLSQHWNSQVSLSLCHADWSGAGPANNWWSCSKYMISLDNSLLHDSTYTCNL